MVLCMSNLYYIHYNSETVSGRRFTQTMAGLEQMRFLIVWANLVGFLPFRMELDSTTGKFLRFAFSLTHPWTWWLIISFLLRVALTITVVLPQSEGLATIGLTLFFICFYIGSLMTFAPYLLLFRWKDLARAAKQLHKFDRIIGDSSNWPCTTKRRIAIGLCVNITNVSFFIGISSIYIFQLTENYFCKGFTHIFNRNDTNHKQILGIWYPSDNDLHVVITNLLLLFCPLQYLLL